jgi:Carboxypeptidase regulatory-like domain
VTGVVRNSAGVPQIGAVVQLLRPDFSVAASVYTNSKGHFAFGTVVPGRYSVKAMGASFLPSLRENVRVQAGTVVNMTLNTLYEVMQWLPAQSRAADASQDDWKWTLRSAANRPLLRWLEDGPLVVVSDGRSKPKLKARLLATGGAGTFGEDGERIAIEVEDTPSESRELLARVDFAPGTDASMESMLGFRQELGFAGSVQSVAAVSIHPEIEGAGAEGLNEASVRSWENINMGDEFQAEAGAQQVLARFAHDSPNTVVAALPFVSVGWRKGDGVFSYRFATAVPDTRGLAETQAGAWLPAMSVRDGRLAPEHGVHQEIGWERRTDNSGVSVLFYSDSLSNPVIEGMVHGGSPVGPDALYDSSSGLLRTAAAGYSSTGIMATVERRLPRGNHVRVSYANGDALVMQASAHPTPLSQLVSSARPRRAQMCSLSLSGILDGTGTRWRASYRWQPEGTVNRIAPYALQAEEPYLNIHLRQPMFVGREGARSLDAMIDMRNLLAQGEHPFVLTDGSLLVFAQDQRGVTAGLAFTF